MVMSKISDIEILNRPREKAILEGIESLSNNELLALIIRCGVKNISALEIADNILNEYSTLSELVKTDIHTIMKVKGIKKAKALELIAVLELTKRINNENARKMTAIKNDEDIYKMVKTELENETQEKFLVIFLNVKLSIIKKITMFQGGDASSLVDINLIYRKAIESGAKKIICVHNHPSGDSTPSDEDLLLTDKIKSVGKILRIEMLDHIIIGKNNYFSFKKNNL